MRVANKHRKHVEFNVFSNCAVVQHLGVEEKPILKMPHLEAASILLVGPTLKKFNDRGTITFGIFIYWFRKLECVFFFVLCICYF